MYDAISTTPDRTNFAAEPIQVTGTMNLDGARIRFGYAENGTVSGYYCTPRQDACITGGSPYSFQSENPGWQPCTGGCTIAIPAIPGRVLYYVVEQRDKAGNVTSGDTQIIVVP